jgi:hypothetical protein
MSDEKAEAVFSHKYLKELLELESTLPEPSLGDVESSLALR